MHASNMFLIVFLLVLSTPLSTSHLQSPPSFINHFEDSTDPPCHFFMLRCPNESTSLEKIKSTLLGYNKTFDYDQHVLKSQNHEVFNITFFKHETSYHHYDNNVGICEHYNLQYNLSMRVPKNDPHAQNCVTLQLPFNKTNLESIRLLSPFSPEFWNLFKPCYNPWRCSNGQAPRGGKDYKTIIIAVTVGSAFIVTLAAAIFIIRRANNHRKAIAYSRDLEGSSVYFGVSLFSYAELQDATQNFDSSQELGDGGFGTVYYGKLRDGREVAVKRLYEHNYKRVQQFMNEVEILTRLRHKNLVSLYGCTSRRSVELLLVYEYIANGTVADHLHGDRAKQSPLTWPNRMKIAVETASALAYLHASEIIHRDVKTNNILLDNNFCVKVADFGLSRLLPNDVTHVSTAPQGTPGYVDPEYHQCYQLTDKSDVYSFGVVLIELISSMPAIDISRSRDEISLAYMAINRIQRCALDELIDPVLGSDSETERMTRSVAELAFRCLQFDSETRPTMNEVLEFLKGIQGEGDNNVGELNVNAGKAQMPPASPETEDVVLLKEVDVVMASPLTVTAKWHSTGSGVTTPTTSG
ncbi:LEAF RUST 10 DISEASE-RESISTANCE LOCUS RECEPTOR-LIKE PROTEIN KINASE-like 1.1 isoform X2 [Lactuca sativa]|uniref:LEAF RUST 10 DISEASE-RESISTANCE LOCUS RECEPTOR-LIKE PROTEIN KINASE-like 1.1 isoform X2 n=1 Tax=Lactuca sativa TaxID=4236 RepID=UPI000CD9C538|nr:LEAF RUST 10 DISEASE-RESISTANCE LOCUS RECEPTOR-LIKE PROTEIN KINASE-like 1.1 isoform X2 [Lactuca sativa]